MSETLTLPDTPYLCKQANRNKTSAIKKFLRRLSASHYPTYIFICTEQKHIKSREFCALKMEQVQADSGENFIISKVHSQEKALEISSVIQENLHAHIYQIQRSNNKIVAKNVGNPKFNSIQEQQVA